jgi:transcriptional regulator with XRE-family HTH domain
MPRFDKLGEALRHLRLHGARPPRKQLEIAADAGVTRGMLSSYENGRQEPSLKTLGRILDALGADLDQLEWALRLVAAAPGETAGRPYATGPTAPAVAEAGTVAERAAVYRTVEVPEVLAPEEEDVLGQMIAGFLAWLRYTRSRAREG